MSENETPFPAWAEHERAGDLAWVKENLQLFWPMAQRGYDNVGRGAIVVDITARPTGEGHPFAYLDLETIEPSEDSDTLRLVQEYDPAQELVTVLLKSQERTSSYRFQVISPQTEPEPQSKAELKAPDLETLMSWETEGGCEAACPHACWVEPDGYCSHENPSWLVKLGLI